MPSPDKKVTKAFRDALKLLMWLMHKDASVANMFAKWGRTLKP